MAVTYSIDQSDEGVVVNYSSDEKRSIRLTSRWSNTKIERIGTTVITKS